MKLRHKKKILLFVSLCLVGKWGAAQVQGEVMANTLKLKEQEQRLEEQDSLFTFLDESEISHLQKTGLNNVYHRRLDSLENVVPLDYNGYVQDFIDLYVNKRKELIGRMISLSKYYFPIFERSFKDEEVPEEIKYLSVVESALNPHAVSRVGATGLWQFMYATGKAYDLSVSNFVDERKDPVLASRAAAAYFRDAFDEFGDWLLAIAAYNCGKGNVQRAIDKAHSYNFWAIRRYLPQETRNYVPAYIAVVYAMNFAQHHGIQPKKIGGVLFGSQDVLYVDKPTSLQDLAKSLRMPLKELQLLNPSYKNHVVYGRPESPCKVVIPTPSRDTYNDLFAVLDNAVSDREVRRIASLKRKEYDRIVGEDELRNRKKRHLVRYRRESIKKVDASSWEDLDIVKKSSVSKGTFTYRVKKGETLSEIAEKYDGLTVRRIKEANNLKSSRVLPGEVLHIPRT